MIFNEPRSYFNILFINERTEKVCFGGFML